MARRNTKVIRGARPLAAAALRDITRRARDAATRLEKVFEERVSGAVARLGIPTSGDVRALSLQVAELRASVERLKRARPRARA